MGRIAKTKSKRTRERSAAKEKNIQLAVEVYNSEYAPSFIGPRRTQAQIARAFHVQACTLSRRRKGGRSLQDVANAKKKLFNEEDDILLAYAIELARRKLPMDNTHLRLKGEAIIQSRPNMQHQQVKLGKQWPYRWVETHSDQIRMYWSSDMDNKCAGALNPTNHREYFDALEELQEKRHFRLENKHAADEMGLLHNMEVARRVIGPVGQKAQNTRASGDRDSSTIMVCICANGSLSMKPMVIFKGVNFMSSWNAHNTMDLM